MYSKKELIVNNDSDIADDSISNEENNSKDDVSDELSLAEQVFTRLKIYSEGFQSSFFTTKDLANLSLTSKSLNFVVSSELNQRKTQKLLTHVIKGKQDKAQAMLEENPELLLLKSEAIDYSGRTIIGTAFRAAIGAGDKPMWEMILPYFEELEEKGLVEEGEALRQFHEQFPNGINETPAAQLQAYYNAIASAIIHDEDHGQSVIEGFRKEITCQKKITQGKHFNMQHLIAAYQAYLNNFYDLDNWKDLFWQKVIGYVQRQMTAYDAQVHCSGVQGVLISEGSFKRTFMLSKTKKLFPLHDNSGVGFDFACYGYYIIGDDGWPKCYGSRGSLDTLMKNYVEQKQIYLLDLERQLNEACINSPVTCS